MADESEIADVAALTKRLCADEIGVWKIPIVDDIRMTAHGSKLYQASFPKDLCVDAFVAFEVDTLP